jgi:hypothetical protein
MLHPSSDVLPNNMQAAQSNEPSVAPFVQERTEKRRTNLRTTLSVLQTAGVLRTSLVSEEPRLSGSVCVRERPSLTVSTASSLVASPSSSNRLGRMDRRRLRAAPPRPLPGTPAAPSSTPCPIARPRSLALAPSRNLNLSSGASPLLTVTSSFPMGAAIPMLYRQHAAQTSPCDHGRCQRRHGSRSPPLSPCLRIYCALKGHASHAGSCRSFGN